MLGNPLSGCHFALCLPLDLAVQWVYTQCPGWGTLMGNIYEWPNRDMNRARVSTVAHNFLNSTGFCYMTTLLCQWKKQWKLQCFCWQRLIFGIVFSKEMLEVGACFSLWFARNQTCQFFSALNPGCVRWKRDPGHLGAHNREERSLAYQRALFWEQ